MSFNSYEKKVGSQNGEAGLIEYIFKVAGEQSKTCVEFGVGSEFNCANQIGNHEWSAFLFDCDKVEVIKMLVRYYNQPKVKVAEEHFTKENINGKFVEHKVPAEIDLLSIDVDGIDLYLWNTLNVTDARFVVVEYNSSLGTERSVTVKYNPDFDRFKLHPEYYGASLQALTKVAQRKGMKLIGTDASGTNAFYAKQNEPFKEQTVEEAFHLHYGRNWRASIKYLEQYGFEEI